LEEAKSLLFIPDISGFTNFVKQTEIVHSKHIISELLEAIIKSNILDLKIAEIEGDAIFFFRKEFIPTSDELSEQTRKMFISFHSHLRYYDTNRICHCGACSTASKLSLKFIVHLGTFEFIAINNIEKPYGEDVILAHKLLKNNIEQKEYLLISGNFSPDFTGDFTILMNDSKNLMEGSTSYETLGEIRYKYIILSHLHHELKAPSAKIHPDIQIHPLKYSGYINAPKEKVFEIVSNLDYRLKINRNASKMDYEKGHVNRAGLVHQCVINNVNYRIETVSNDFGENALVYGEMIEKTFFSSRWYTYTILESQDAGTRLRYEVHLDIKPIIGRIVIPVLRLLILPKLKVLFQQIKDFSERDVLT